MRDYKKELELRIQYVRDILKLSNSKGIVFGNSGGKDSALTGIICKLACDNTVGVIMPCTSVRNYGDDLEDAKEVAGRFNIETRIVDLTKVREEFVSSVGGITELSRDAKTNIAPRLRMATLYAVAASEGRLVAGTDNKSEIHMGYFTKWGDGSYDFNVIGDLTATEVFEFLRYLKAPSSVIEKAPSAGLFEGQTDEGDMGITYAAIDKYIMTGEASEHDLEIINRYHNSSRHKREPTAVYPNM